MKFRLAVLVLAAAGALAAQSSSGYLFLAPGGVTSSGRTEMMLHAGGGGDAVIGKGIGVNVELGAIWPRECFVECVMGAFSPGGTYHFRRGAELKLDPFVAGGYTLMFRGASENLFYFGGGANYWFSRKVGLRMEMRDHVWTGYRAAHFWNFRLGLAFR